MSLQVTNLSKNFGTQKALNSVAFSAVPGRILGFLGPNGAGKSTTMKIICGYLPANEGEVSILGEDALGNPKKVSKMIGYLPEHNPLYLDMYVLEFLKFAGGLYGLSGKTLESRIQEMLDKTGLNPEKHKKIGQLSKGYRQRVGLAKALIHDPKVIILDEPTTGLDPNQLVEIRALIKEVSKDKTVILSTHIMQEVEAICDDVVIISQGEIKASETLDNLKSGSDKTDLILETEESLDDKWFEGLDLEEIKSNGKEVVIHSIDPKEDRKKVMAILAKYELNLIRLDQQKKGLEEIFRELTS